MEHEERVQDAGAAGGAGWFDDPSSGLIPPSNAARAAASWSTSGWLLAADGQWVELHKADIAAPDL